MKSTGTSAITISLVVLIFCVTSVEGTILKLSTHSSEDESQPYLTEYLDAQLDFSVVDSTLTLSVTNLTPENQGDPAFKISRIYFNTTDEIEGLTLTDVTSSDYSSTNGWNLGFSEDGFLVGGSGHFDVYLKGGNGSHSPVVNTDSTVNFVFQINGTGPFNDGNFITLSSPQGGHIISYAAAKFYNDNSSAFGATNIPEPATICIFALGGLMLARKRARGLN